MKWCIYWYSEFAVLSGKYYLDVPSCINIIVPHKYQKLYILYKERGGLEELGKRGGRGGEFYIKGLQVLLIFTIYHCNSCWTTRNLTLSKPHPTKIKKITWLHPWHSKRHKRNYLLPYPFSPYLRQVLKSESIKPLIGTCI